MARPRQLIAGAAALAVAASSPSAAGALPTLSVDALSMRADRTRVAIGESFHLAIHVHVRQNVAALDDLVVPDLGTMQQLGDERHTTHAPAGAAKPGTDVVETLTLSAVAAGRYTFAPAYIDAIDARDGKPKRFSAERPVTVVVAAPALPGFDAWPLVRRTASAALILGGIAAALLVLASLGRVRRRRERPVVTATPEHPAAPPAPPPSARERVAAALRAYRVSPGDAAAVRLRAELFAAAGVSAGATLRDALRGCSDAALRSALGAAEHAAFGPAHERDAASDTLVRSVEGWLA